MPKLITQDRLKTFVKEGIVLQNADEASVDGIKYDFRLGDSFLKSSFGEPMKISDLNGLDRAKARVEPGEFVFVVSEEKIELEQNVFFTLSPKRKISHEGVLVLGGLCVDPGYKGHLLIGLYNFGSQSFRLERGKKIVSGLFYLLNEDEISDFPPPKTTVTGFPDELIHLIGTYQPTNVRSISEELIRVSKELSDIKSEIRDGKNWQLEFRKDMDLIKEGIRKISENLDKEIQVRQGETKDLESKYSRLIGEASIKNGLWKLAQAIFLLIIGGLITYFTKGLWLK